VLGFAGMFSGDPTGGGTGPSQAADWRNWLDSDALFTPSLREGYRVRA
jgi:hypothetical protein